MPLHLMVVSSAGSLSSYSPEGGASRVTEGSSEVSSASGDLWWSHCLAAALEGGLLDINSRYIHKRLTARGHSKFQQCFVLL